MGSAQIKRVPGRGLGASGRNREAQNGHRGKLPGGSAEQVAGFVFVTPMTILLIVFYFVPLLETIYYSFMRWDPASPSPPKFIGLANYRDLASAAAGFGAAA